MFNIVDFITVKGRSYVALTEHQLALHREEHLTRRIAYITRALESHKYCSTFDELQEVIAKIKESLR